MLDRRTIWRIASLAVSAILLALVLSQLSISSLVEVAKNANPAYLVAFAGTSFLATFLRARRFGYLFPDHHNPATAFGLSAYMRMVTFAMPMHSGEVVFLGLLKKHRFVEKISYAVPRWLLLRISDIVGLFLTCVTATIIMAWHWKATETHTRIAFVLAATSAVIVIGLLSAPTLVLRFSTPGWRESMSQRFPWMADSIRVLRTSQNVGWTIAFGVFAWLTLGVALATVQIALDSPLAAAECLLVASLVMLVQLVPIRAPLGLGTADAAWVASQTMLAVPLETAVSIAVGVRLLQIAMTFAEGLVGAVMLHRLDAQKTSE